ncbi:disulfide bond formation protein B [Paracoccus sp. TK19116]|uniref:Disulfide bond formation protein B n=1 Tax=Paracoccus albicereus TaxID=2922394 RepID=A0ABT1MQQ5_9RHOB|nr:disulfide bond formation protein B [Paracoccus albicereus]MCQ0969663.1 disulfide bond formation protein B [Paracoccus albicereus]
MTEHDQRMIAVFAGLGSLLLLAAAFAFQAAGYAPCELCILQRWPHVLAIVAGIAVWRLGARRWLLWLGLLGAAGAVAIATYHSGVEWGWWQGPTACSGGVGNLTQLSTEDLMKQLQAAPVVRCDEPALKILGVTMANMNALASAVLALIWIAALRMRRA